MALIHSPSPVLTNLELNLDIKSAKSFSNTLGPNLATHYSYNAATWAGVFLGTNTAGIDAPDGSKTAVRHTPHVITGTYTITSNVATIKIVDHPFSSTQNLTLDFTSGGGVDGLYTITKVDADIITANVTAANTSGNVTVYGRSGFRVNLPSFTPNGTDRYTFSFWVRLVSGTFYPGSGTSADLADGVPSVTYTPQLVQDKWVYVTATGVPTATAKTFIDLAGDYWGTAVLDFWGLKVENQTVNTSPMKLRDSIGGYTFDLYRPEYSKFDVSNDSITFDRTTAANTAMTISSIVSTGTTLVTATVPSTTGWSANDAFTITGAVGTEESKLNGVWVISNVLSGTTFNFGLSSAMATGTYTANLGTATKSSKWGGQAITTGVGNLTALNFFYNNHTFEVWFKINDRTASNLDTTEQYSFLAGYAGWHSGFLYVSNSFQYLVKDGASSLPAVCSWTLGTSGTQIIQGQWYQVAVVRNGAQWIPYLNGVQLGTGTASFTPSNVDIGVSNLIGIGGAPYYAKVGQSRYQYYAKNSVGAMRMYSRALTSAEIYRNFSSLRGRFGI